MKRAPSRKKPDVVEDRLLKAAALYLESKAWKPLVIGVDRIQGPVDAPFNFEFVIRFTGKKRDAVVAGPEDRQRQRVGWNAGARSSRAIA